MFRETVIGAVEKHAAASVPMLIGTNTEETRYFIALDAMPLDQQAPQTLRRGLVTALELEPAGLAGEAQAIIDRYLASGVPQPVAFETLLSDAIFPSPSIRLRRGQHRPATDLLLFVCLPFPDPRSDPASSTERCTA